MATSEFDIVGVGRATNLVLLKHYLAFVRPMLRRVVLNLLVHQAPKRGSSIGPALL